MLSSAEEDDPNWVSQTGYRCADVVSESTTWSIGCTDKNEYGVPAYDACSQCSPDSCAPGVTAQGVNGSIVIDGVGPSLLDLSSIVGTRR